MRRRLAIAAGAALCLAAGLAGALPAAQAAGPGIHVSNGRLVERNGADLVLRGINHAHTWYPTQTGSFAGIKAAGANSIRVVLANGTRWTANSASDVTNVISLCKTNKLICMLEVHDTTGYGEQSGAATLSQAADYWVSLKSVLAGQEDYVLVNIGNEPFGNTGYAAWTADTSAAIKKIRDAGITNTIVVDAPNWGQDWTFTMRDNAPTVAAADPTGNTVFSIHMYGVFDTAAEVTAYLDSFISRKLPIIVGEFGNMHSDGDPDEDTIMSYTTSKGIGMLGWSWSGNGGGVEYLDMVTGFNASARTTWGTRFITGANGLSSGTKEATIYSGATVTPTATSTTATPTVTPTTTSPTVTPTSGTRTCTATYALKNTWPGGFQAEVTVTAGASAISSWTASWTYPGGQTVSSLWGGQDTASGSSHSVRNLSYNGSLAAGSSTSFGLVGSGTAGTAPSVTCAAG